MNQNTKSDHMKDTLTKLHEAIIGKLDETITNGEAQSLINEKARLEQNLKDFRELRSKLKQELIEEADDYYQQAEEACDYSMSIHGGTVRSQLLAIADSLMEEANEINEMEDYMRITPELISIAYAMETLSDCAVSHQSETLVSLRASLEEALHAKFVESNGFDTDTHTIVCECAGEYQKGNYFPQPNW